MQIMDLSVISVTSPDAYVCVVFTYLLFSSLTSCIFIDHLACATAKSNLLLLTIVSVPIEEINSSLPLQSLLLAKQTRSPAVARDGRPYWPSRKTVIPSGIGLAAVLGVGQLS